MIKFLGVISEFDEYEQTPSTPNGLTGTITKLCMPFQSISNPSFPQYTSSTRIDISNASPGTGKVHFFSGSGIYNLCYKKSLE